MMLHKAEYRRKLNLDWFLMLLMEVKHDINRRVVRDNTERVSANWLDVFVLLKDNCNFAFHNKFMQLGFFFIVRELSICDKRQKYIHFLIWQKCELI